MHVFQTLKRPVITEKSTLLQESNKYVFEVVHGSNKPQIKEAVERAFAVTVLSVNIVPEHKEIRRRGSGRSQVLKTPKKAIVTLAQGDTIQLFEGA
jgi:large subunit ribosomal protein L23